MIILNRLKKYKIQIFLFLFIAIAYTLLTGGNFWEYDSFSAYKLAKNIVDKSSFSVNCFWGVPGLHNNCYSRYGLFMSAAVVPFYIIEKIYLEVVKGSFFFPGFFPSLTNVFITALLSVLIFSYLKKFKFSSKLSIVGALLYAFFTFAFAYTKTIFAEPLITLLIYSCLYVLLFYKSSHKKYFFAGLLFGLGFLTKITMVIILPVVFYLFWINRKEWKKMLIFFLPLIFLFIIWCIYNNARFGNIFDTGYKGIGFGENILRGLYLFILSPGKSIFIYQPFIIFFIFGLKKFFLKNKKAFISFSLLSAIHFIFYSMYSYQAGEWAWGSRFLYSVLPFFVFCVIFFLQNEKNKLLKFLFYLSVGISFIIQLSSVYISYHRYYSYMSLKYGRNFTRLVYPRFDYSPIFGQWKLIFRLGYSEKDKKFWHEAFQERINFNTNYKIASPDLFFFRSKKFSLFLLLACVIEFLLIKKIYDSL